MVVDQAGHFIEPIVQDILGAPLGLGFVELPTTRRKRVAIHGELLKGKVVFRVQIRLCNSSGRLSCGRSGSSIASLQELELLDHDAGRRLLLAVLGGPLLGSQAAGNHQRITLLDVLADRVSRLPECLAAGKKDLFLVLTGLTLPAAIGCQTEATNGASLGERFDFGVFGEVSDQDDLIE